MLGGKLQNYIDWRAGTVMFLPERNNYAYRITLKYQDGRKVQYSSRNQALKHGKRQRRQDSAQSENCVMGRMWFIRM